MYDEMQGMIQLMASYIFGHHMFKYSNTLIILKNTVLNKNIFNSCLHNYCTIRVILFHNNSTSFFVVAGNKVHNF